MGTDSVTLFDKSLCDAILTLEKDQLPAFLQERLDEFGGFSDFNYGFAADVPATDRIRELYARGRSTEELKSSLVDALCVSDQQIRIDYWACYAEVFSSGEHRGAIPDFKIFPHSEEQRYLLLLPEHVDQMLASLDAHVDELEVMEPQDVSLLRSWRELCVGNPAWMVAYFFDY